MADKDTTTAVDAALTALGDAVASDRAGARRTLTAAFSGDVQAEAEFGIDVGSVDIELRRMADGDRLSAWRALVDGDDGAAIATAWIVSRAHDSGLRLAPLIRTLRGHARQLAADRRFHHGPPADALAAATLMRADRWDDVATRYRLDILVRDAARTGQTAPILARLVLDPRTRKRLIEDALGGDLWTQATAAQLLLLSAAGIRRYMRGPEPDLASLVQSLAGHPDPEVWIPAVRALGRLAPELPTCERLLWRWIDSDHIGVRRRSVTALASIPVLAGNELAKRLSLLGEPEADPHELAALGPALPTLAVEWPDRWQAVAWRMVGEEDAPVVSSAVAGLLPLASAGGSGSELTRLLRAAAERAGEATNSQMTAGYWWRVDRLVRRAHDEVAEDDLMGHLDLAVAAAAHGDEPVRLRRRVEHALSEIGGVLTDDEASVSAVGAAVARASDLGSLLGLRPWLRLSVLPPLDRHEADAALQRRAEREVRSWLDSPSISFAAGNAALRVTQGLVTASAGHADDDRFAGPLALAEAGPWRTGGDRSKKERRRHRRALADTLSAAALQCRTADQAPAAGWGRLLAWLAVGADAALWSGLVERADLTGIPDAQIEDMETAAARLRALIRQEGELATANSRSSLEDALRTLGAEETWIAVALGELQVHAERWRSGETTTDVAVPVEVTVRLLDLCRRCPAVALARPTDRQLPEALDASEIDAKTLLPALGAAHLAPMLDAESQPSVDGGPMFDTLPFTPTDPSAADVASAPTLMSAETLTSARTMSPFGSGSAQTTPMGGVPVVPAVLTRSAPDRVDQYVIEKELGRGGQSVVYLVRRQSLADRYFVLKLPLDASAKPTSTLSRAVLHEVERLAEIYHPNVINIVDTGYHNGRPYVVTDYLIGAPASQYYAPPMDANDPAVLALVRDVCAALSRLARQGVVHRDVKPDNLYVQLDMEPGQGFEPEMHRELDPLKVVLLDFGITVTTSSDRDALVSGTPGFIAPEQYRGARHPGSDIYALSGVVFWMLTGRRFFEDDIKKRRFTMLAMNTLERSPSLEALDDKGVPTAIRELLREGVDLDPDRRPSAREFAKRFREGVAIVASLR